MTAPASPTVGAKPGTARPHPPRLGEGPPGASVDGLHWPPLPRFVQIEPIGR